jgi:hypothetical protein
MPVRKQVQPVDARSGGQGERRRLDLVDRPVQDRRVTHDSTREREILDAGPGKQGQRLICVRAAHHDVHAK